MLPDEYLSIRGLRRWWEAVRRIANEIRDDNAPTLAAAIALSGLLALAPALIALFTVCSLVTDPQTVRDQRAPLAASSGERKVRHS
ncbi:hypothetical protein [Amycolatopsis thermophila]|uniref:Uncharacterized BrkB/YihY/UPF0761 family membrane protein n=1 Tax=Amycolatopsis thermophila TaxID=206084 RepID=A0ABU0F5Q1_9PSEU|nr:hypothetical protein [Amycolatopsis thermophila]MDQ0382921.1 uncharacterized BrkB/YihY/UPF0761 family membrane protein [Amycolatopsis thermophila]